MSDRQGPETIEIEGANGRKLGIRVVPILDEDHNVVGWRAETRELRWVPTDLSPTSGNDRQAVIDAQREEIEAAGWMGD